MRKYFLALLQKLEIVRDTFTSTPAHLLAILFGLLALPPVLMPEFFSTMTLPLRLLTVCVFVTIASYTGYLLTKRSLPADEYARVHLARRNNVDKIDVLSKEAAHALQLFLDKTKTMDSQIRFFLDLEEGVAVTPLTEGREDRRGDLSITISKEYGLLERLRTSQVDRLNRIQSMKEMCSKDLGIPIRRFCEHVLQYSPNVHRLRMQKYLTNLHDIDELSSQDGGLSLTRMSALSRQNVRIVDEMKRRLNVLNGNIRNKELFRDVLDIASSNSTTGALRLYASALARLAERNVLNGEGDKARLRQADEEVRFLARKQRSYPGYSLNALLSAITSDSKLAVLLKDLPAHWSFDPMFVVGSKLQPPPYTIDDCRLDIFPAMRRLPRDLDDRIRKARPAITSGFQRFLEAKCEAAHNRGGRVFLMTYAYSAVVRDVLRDSYEEMSKAQQRLPDVYLVRSQDSDLLSTQIMELELRETDARGHPLTGISSGPIEALVSVLRDRDEVVIAIGADRFDENHCLLHPHGIAEVLRRTIKRMGKHSYHVCVLAEAFKKHDEPLDREVTGDDHYGQVTLYRGVADRMTVISA